MLRGAEFVQPPQKESWASDFDAESELARAPPLSADKCASLAARHFRAIAIAQRNSVLHNVWRGWSNEAAPGGALMMRTGRELAGPDSHQPPRSGPRRSAIPVHPEPASERPNESVPLRVLVIDDDQDARELLVYFLQSKGLDVHSVDSAERAITELSGFAPDVILSDIGMPFEDGYSFIRRVRALPSPRTSRLPAIAVTAFSRAEDKAMALKSGFDAHVSKPVALANLFEAIVGLAASRQA